MAHDWYAWVKAAHIVALIAWMAAMLYLPRLFVYHAGVPVGSPQSATFKVMERRLARAIMTPAMLATWVLGLVLLLAGDRVDLAEAGWLHAKLLLVLGLSALHGLFLGWVRAFAEDRNRRSARFYRVANEVPTVLLIGSVLLAVVKPF